ncbi:hypothetical protein R9X47_01650 [Wukongibacter baidiensis]|uniref:hypothetical protein n=1 Tax=Wukongibacter baidiensis TaxID=1723361 RepID=UPI003D7FE9C3
MMISAILIIVGIFTFTCTLKKPNFFWEHRKAKLLRKTIGDKATSIFYFTISLIITVVGLFVLIGEFI